MPPRQIIDSHVHLWPEDDANTTSHSWMTPGHALAEQFSIDDYLEAISHGRVTIPGETTVHSEPSYQESPILRGIIYIETDRALPPASPELSAVARWTHPLAELAWLRRLVDGTPREDEGHGAEHASLLLGLVPWAPVDEGAEVVESYLRTARKVLGDQAWQRVKGWRFLLQGMSKKEDFDKVVLGPQFAEGLRSLAQERSGWVFDVGVDQHNVGIWQLEGLASCLERLREEEEDEVEEDEEDEDEEEEEEEERKKVDMDMLTFVLNHLCKPNFERAHFSAWERTMRRLSALPNVYMKLSGGFSEATPAAPFSAEEYYDGIRPWVRTVLKYFTPNRIMFGSDWPVCTMGGPGYESWASWKEVVECALETENLSDEDQEWIWWRTAAKAYRLNVPK